MNWVKKALLGRWCRECQKHRTKNPSITCTSCLGGRACGKCGGTGIHPRDPIAACPDCPGTGLRSTHPKETKP